MTKVETRIHYKNGALPKSHTSRKHKLIKMNKIKHLLLIGVILSTTTFVGCKKEGCTDINATNYDSEAKDDDGSCRFEGSVQFWYNQATSENLLDDGSASLTFSVDGEVIGSYAASVFFASNPSCGQASVVRTTKDLGSAKTKTSTYRVVDDFGDEIWTGNVTFDAADECLSIELTY